MRLSLSRVCGLLTVAAAVLVLPVPAAAQAGTAAPSTSTQAPPTSQTKPPPSDQAAQPAATPDPLAEDYEEPVRAQVEHVPALRSCEQHLG